VSVVGVKGRSLLAQVISDVLHAVVGREQPTLLTSKKKFIEDKIKKEL
jgi:hypothetical protein